MTAGWKEKIYRNLPIPLQNFACGVEGRRQRNLRYGGEFRALLDKLEESQWWSAAEIEEYQQGQLKKLIEHAYQSVPYYRRVFDERRLKPADIKSVEDLHKLP